MNPTATVLCLIIVGMGVVTYAIRLSLILLLGRLRVSPIVRQALRFVPPAVLSAIVFPSSRALPGTLMFSPGNARLLAGLLAGVVAWRSKNVFLAIAVGMAALWVLQAVLPG